MAPYNVSSSGYERAESAIIGAARRAPLDGWQGRLKRVFDVSVAAAGVILLAPVWLVIIPLIKIDSRGPVFYKQKRLTKDLRPFELYKFRSMTADADELREKLQAMNEMDGPIFKIRNDPRVTWVGRWLRRFSLDELPQLINVLRGEMSIVGPRPPLPEEVANYEHWHLKRLRVQQGITGLWQVSGRNLLGFKEMLALDIEYIENWSFWSDLKIFFRTFNAVLSRRGAY